MMNQKDRSEEREAPYIKEKIFDKHLIPLLFWASRCGRTKGGSRVLGTYAMACFL